MGPKTSVVTTVRGRFNLLVNFVLSEIVLTHPIDHALLVDKFIRLAWVCISLFFPAWLMLMVSGAAREPSIESIRDEKLQHARCDHQWAGH